MWQQDPFAVPTARQRPPRQWQRAVGLPLLGLAVLAPGAWLLYRSSGSGGGGARGGARVDVVFVVDATGSMAGEIADVKTSLLGIGNRLANRKPQPDVRFGAVFYRDQSDREIVRAAPLSRDLASVRDEILDVEATGGGDWPEHVGIGLHKALEMDWSHSAAGGVRLIYLVGDAPPKNYDDGYDVDSAVILAKHLGTKINVLGVRGLGSGEPSMRRIAEATGGSFSWFERDTSTQHSAPRHRTSKMRSASSTDRGGVGKRKGEGGGFGSVHGTSRRRVLMADWSEKTIDGPIVGMALGGTEATVGIYKNGRVEIIPNSEGSRTTPACVAYLDHGEILVGRAARDVALTNDSQALCGFKSLLGQRFDNRSVQDLLPRLPYRVVERDGMPAIQVTPTAKGETESRSPEEVAALVYGKLKENTENYLGKEVRHAVLTVPAHFGDSQRQAAKSAGELAGLQVLRVISEPTAAAISYGLDKHTEKTILVYDLGGTTLDVTLLTIDNGVFEVVATDGDSHLGGADFDDRLVQHLAREFQDKHGRDISGDARAMYRLRREASQAKRVLSSTRQVQVEVDDLLAGLDFAETLTRARFEHLCKDLFDRVVAPVERVLAAAGLRLDQVDEIVPVGGSTRIPKIMELVQEFFRGKEWNRGINPEEAVAYGGSVQAGILSGEGGSDLLLLDVTPLTIGIDAGGFMAPLISRNSVIPNARSQLVSTHSENQSTIRIRVYEGERPLVADNHLLAEFNVSGLKPGAAGEAQVQVTLSIDTNGILHASAEDSSTRANGSVTVSNDKGRLTEEDIERMIKDAEKHAAADAAARTSLPGATNASSDGCDACLDLVGRPWSEVPSHAEEDYEDAESDADDEVEAPGAEAAADEAAETVDDGLGRLSRMMAKSIEEEL